MASDAVGCNIIVDDLSYITESFFKDGQVANSVNAANAAGVAYFTSAGNFSDASFEDTFRGVTIPSQFDITGQAHDFGGGDIF